MSPEEKNTIHEGTRFDLLYSRSKGINKRRGVHDGIYPIKELDTRKTYPRKNYKRVAKKNIVVDSAAGLQSDEKTQAVHQNQSKAADPQKIEVEEESPQKSLRK